MADYAGENASQVAEIVNGVYGANTVTTSYVQVWFRRFRSGIFDVKDASRTGRLVIENVDTITEKIEIGRHPKLALAPLNRTINHVYLVGLENNLLLLVASIWPNTKFRSLLSTNGTFEASGQKRPELASRRVFVFHQDNASPHMSLVTRQKLWELGWEDLMHPPYNTDQAPSDYQIFSHCNTS
ncbi:HTH_48 domain-containing protein [Trichonephila clavipes]|nr:HTH_48 domain-containing protein [Trichonephila clavipes]